MKQRSVENNTNTMAYKFKILIPARGGSKRIPKKNIIDKNDSPKIMLDAHNPNLIIRHKVLNGKSEDVVVNNIKLQKWTHNLDT